MMKFTNIFNRPQRKCRKAICYDFCWHCYELHSWRKCSKNRCYELIAFVMKYGTPGMGRGRPQGRSLTRDWGLGFQSKVLHALRPEASADVLCMYVQLWVFTTQGQYIIHMQVILFCYVLILYNESRKSNKYTVGNSMPEHWMTCHWQKQWCYPF